MATVEMKSSGIGELTSMLDGHLKLIQTKDAVVEKIISIGSHADSLHDAKAKALENEKSLLLSIVQDIDEMNTFLKNIILIENLFNSMYQPFKKKQEAARSAYAKTIAKYEGKPKPQSVAKSFVELVFGGQTHVSSFQSWLDKVTKQCKKENIEIISNSGAKIKKIERAFYKAFYVYAEDEGFKDMTDILRCSLVFNDFENLYKCFSVIETISEDTLGGVLRVKDRFHPTIIPFGYRDLLVNIYCPQSKIVAEIQLHFIGFYKYKKISHKMYKRARLFERDAGNLAYQYSTKFLRPKIGTFEVYNASKDEVDDDDVKSDETESVTQLLKQWGLQKYEERMIEEGWDDLVYWKDITDDDLKNDMGFSKGHIRKFRGKYNEWLQTKPEKAQVKDDQKTEIKPKEKTEIKEENFSRIGGDYVHGGSTKTITGSKTGVLLCKWDNGRPDAHGTFDGKTGTGSMTFPDDKRYTFEFDGERILWSNHGVWKRNVLDIDGDYVHGNSTKTITGSKTGVLLCKWDNGRPDAHGTFDGKTGKGSMTFPDDKRYTFEFNGERILWSNHGVWKRR